VTVRGVIGIMNLVEEEVVIGIGIGIGMEIERGKEIVGIGKGMEGEGGEMGVRRGKGARKGERGSSNGIGKKRRSCDVFVDLLYFKCFFDILT
jgi:hypothetical protein